MEYLESFSKSQMAGIVLQLVLLPFLFMTLRRFWLAKQSVNWPKTQGVIVKGLDFPLSRNIDFLYTYEINGTSYKGMKPFFANSFKKIKYRKASELMAYYTKDKQVSVYYNPSKPKISTLEPGRMDGVIGASILLLLLFLLGFISFYNPTILVEMIDYITKQ